MTDLHPAVKRFVEQFEREAVLSGMLRKRVGELELAFLEQVWGPTFGYDFSGLQAEYPFKDFKGGQRFADFVYVKQEIRLVLELDGFTTHARDISPTEFDDHLRRQNDLSLSGWLILRFSSRQVMKLPQICQRQIKLAIGHQWSMANAGPSDERSHLWKTRLERTLQIARRQQRCIRPADVAAAFGISARTATDWLRRFAEEGWLIPVNHQKRITKYWLTEERGTE